MQTNGSMNGRVTRISAELLHDVSITNSPGPDRRSPLALTPNRWPVPSLSEIPSCINVRREYSVRSKCSNRRRALSTNYSSCSARCAARAGHTCTGALAEQRGTKREREREAAPVGTGAATLPRLIPRSEDIASWTRRVRVLSPYATIGANWTRFRVHGVAWNGRRKRGGGTEERLQGEVEEGDGRCSTCVQVASFRLAVKVLSFVPRFESCRRSRRQELAVQAGHAHLSRIYRPPVFPVLSARGIP